MKPGDELTQCFPNRGALSAHFLQECTGKGANTLPFRAQNTQNPARYLAETWQGPVSKDIQQNGGNTVPGIYIIQAKERT